MQALLSIEWMKLKRYRTFWILIGFFAFLLPAWNYALNAGIVNLMGGNKNGGGIDILNKAYGFDYVWQNMGFWTSLFVIFLAALIIIITTNEYQYRTNRQNVIDGLTRLQFFHTKCWLVLWLAILTTVYVFIVGFIFGITNGSMGDFPGEIQNLFYVFVLALNYYSFALVLSVFMKRSGLTMGMFFLYCIFIESLAKGLLNWKIDWNPGNYLPLQCSDELLPFPILDFVKSLAKLKEAPPNTPYVIMSFVWIAVYYIVARRKLLKSDW